MFLVWTAASKDYALFVIDNNMSLKLNQIVKLDYIFFTYHCDISKKFFNSNIKQLKTLWDIFQNERIYC